MENKKGNGRFSVHGMCHLTREFTFFPAKDGNPKHNHANSTGIVNTAFGKTVPMPVIFWGKYADAVVCHLGRGSYVFIDGELGTYDEKTGTIGKDGKEITHPKSEINVKHFEFGGSTQGELRTRVRKNLIAMIATGLMPPTVPTDDATIDAIIKTESVPTLEYNAQLAELTGMHGRAKVWIDGRGFIGPNNKVVVPQNVAAPAETPVMTYEQMKYVMDQMKAMVMSPAVAPLVAPVADIAVPVDVFASASVV